MKNVCLIWNRNTHTHTQPQLMYRITHIHISLSHDKQQSLWRNGSASDSSSEGCVFKSCPGQYTNDLGGGKTGAVNMY